MKNKNKKKYMTKRRQSKLKVKKAIVILLAIMAGVSVIGIAEKKATADNITLAEISYKAIRHLPENLDRGDLTVEEQIRKIAKESGFKWTDYLCRLAKCESNFDPNAIGDNGKSRGLFQIHSGYHPTVSTEQAMDVEFSTKWTMDKINKGKQHLWSCDRTVRNN